MSVQKFIVGEKTSNFTTFSNKVLQGFNNYEALGLYAYLLSLPTGWEFYKDQLSTHGNIGRDKINKLLKILENHNLVRISQVRNVKGQFSHFDLQVLDGNDFKINNITENKEPFTEKPFTDNQLLDNSSYKRNINKLNKKNKLNNKSFCVSRLSKDEKPKPKPKPKKKSAIQKEVFKKDNEKRHDFAPMKNEAAHIERSNEHKRMKLPPEFKDIMEKLKRKSMING
jgi:hypothetical protein